MFLLDFAPWLLATLYALVSIFVGTVPFYLFFIFVMSNPFVGPSKIAPTPIELIIKRE